MKILVTGDDVDSTLTRIRLREPLAALARQTGWAVRFVSLHQVRRAQLHAADVLVLQRGMCARSLALMQHMRASGGRVVYEIDDLLFDAAAHLRDHRQLVERSALVLKALWQADAVTTTTERLAAMLRPLARRVALAPNFAPPQPPQAGARRPHAPLTLLLAASDHVEAAFLAPAVARVQDARPGALRVVCIGPVAEVFRGSGALVQALPLLPRGDFLDFIASQLNPLLAIPLDGSNFSACKSAVKFFDAAAVGVPVMCSRRPPYADVVVDGVTGMLVDDTVGAWERALLQALDDPGHLEALARVARADVQRRFAFPATVAAWQRLLQELAPCGRGPVPAWLRLQVGVDELVHRVRAANRERLRRRRSPGRLAGAPATVLPVEF